VISGDAMRNVYPFRVQAPPTSSNQGVTVSPAQPASCTCPWDFRKRVIDYQEISSRHVM
jgi:hypothetical protein